MKKYYGLVFFAFIFLNFNLFGQNPQQSWSKQFNYSGASSDNCTDIEIDDKGNCWTIGFVDNFNKGIDWIVIKRNAVGDTLWTQTYNGPVNGTDKPVDIYIDGAGVCYIVGTIQTKNNGLDVAVVSYTSSGLFNWDFIYNFNGYGRYNTIYNVNNEEPLGIKENSQGYLVVVGNGNPFLNRDDAEIFIFTLAKVNGSFFDDEIIFGDAYTNNNSIYYEDIPTSFDVIGNRVFIASEKRSAKTNYWSLWAIHRYNFGSTNYPGIYNDMGSMNGGTIGYVNYFIYPSGSFYSGKDFNYPSVITGDAAGNMIISGVIDTISSTGSYYKISTIKVPQNQMAYSWKSNYDNGNGDLKYVNDIKYDVANENTYITGWVTNTNKDLITLKYNKTGSLLWSKTKNGRSNKDDMPVSIQLDNNKNPIICANMLGSSMDVGLIKYNNNNGNEMWVITIDNSNTENAIGHKIDQYNDIYIGGTTSSNSQSNNIFNLRYCSYFPNTTVSSNASICPSANVQLNSSGGKNYKWIPTIGLSNSKIKNPIATPLLTTKYFVEISENYGCKSLDSVIITLKSKPSAPILTTTNILCENSDIKLNANSATNGVTYSWIGPNSFSSNTQNPVLNSGKIINSGKYKCNTIFDGCYSDTSFININITPTPQSPKISSNSPICVGKSINLNAVFIDSASYLWSGPLAFTNTSVNPQIINSTVNQSGTYKCKLKLNECESDWSILLVEVSSTPTAILSSAKNYGCVGDSILVTATEGTYYKWHNGIEGVNSQSINVGNTQFANCIVNNPNGCIGDATTPNYKLSFYNLPVKPIITQQNDALISSKSKSYQWYKNGNPISGAINQIYLPLENGKYIVKIVNENDCEAFSNLYQYYPTSINNLQKNKISIYPNPTHGNFTIKGLSVSEIFLYNILGELVLNIEIKSDIENNIDLSNLNAGVYLLNIGSDFYKIIKN